MAVATLPGWGQRLTALSLALLVGGGTIYLLADQVLLARYRRDQAILEQQLGRWAQLQRIAASREPIQQLIARLQQDRTVMAQYLPQTVPALAAAELQQRVKAAVDAVGGTLQSTQALPPVEEGNAIKVTVSAAMTGDLDSVRKVLYALESQTPLLFVNNLQVAARENRPRLPDGRMADYIRVQLNTLFEVSGYLRKAGG